MVIKNNPYVLRDANGIDDALVIGASYAIAYEARTANLLAVYQDPAIMSRLDDATCLELQNEIIKRTGIRKLTEKE